ncbi:MAG: membrane protein insertion efficiency factor YidD [Betaproteobacteria bacterium]|nr:MAG: membrane protein insertion efficiency factor YidD [Betaproteobacteria bacterium]
MRPVLATAILAYQRYVSPFKRFRCAYAVLHRGRSCSAYGLRLSGRVGLLNFLRLMSRRVRKCRSAYLTLSESAHAQVEERTKPEGERNDAGYCPRACALEAAGCACRPWH